MIIVDTNVASELMKREPDAAVRAWAQDVPRGQLCLTAVSLAEIRFGIERLPPSRRRRELEAMANEVFGDFSDQVLPFDATAAVHYGSVVAGRERLGQSINGFDAQIASICLARDATLATRNTKDFVETGVDLIDPWRPA